MPKFSSIAHKIVPRPRFVHVLDRDRILVIRAVNCARLCVVRALNCARILVGTLYSVSVQHAIAGTINRSHVFLCREWHMERTFQSAMLLFNPEVVFVLGE